METRTKRNILYAIPAVLFIPACLWASPTSGTDVPPMPPIDDTPTIEIATREPTANPTVAAGSFVDFQLFAAEIDASLASEDISFFDKHVTPSAWTCLGDETIGVCKDVAADTTLEGIPITWGWESYTVYSSEDYKALWQTRFTYHSKLNLVALANKLGDNPLMPMADQSFLAIISVWNDPLSFPEVRILFFEHIENAWYIRGELVATENDEAWLDNTCDTCYDTWTAWQQ